MAPPHVRLMSERRYTEVPIDKIRVLNSRNRDKGQFQENVRSIGEVGLLKPIVVNDRHHKRHGYYELVCGQGRYLAYKQLGRTEIPAEVISCSRKEALLYSLVENIARVPPGTMWFAREVKRMHDAGFSYVEVGRIVGKCDTYVRDYVTLVERGEERLIQGVEQGLFSMAFAVRVAKSEGAGIQHLMMDAFDSGMITSKNIPTIRKVIGLRAEHGKQPHGVRGKNGYTLTTLREDIARITRDKESFVGEGQVKENRLLSLLDGLTTLWGDAELVALAEAEGLGQWPDLEGQYAP